MASGFSSLTHVQKESEVGVRYFFPTSPNPKSGPINSPDYNTMDYYTRDAIVKSISRAASNIKAYVIDRLKEAFGALSRDIYKINMPYSGVESRLC